MALNLIDIVVRFLGTLLLLAAAVNTFAQTKKITIEDPLLRIKETFSVKKKDPQIKEGKYVAYRLVGNNIICDGYYKNNLKDSVWRFYDLQGKVIEKGCFKNDAKIGVWNALTRNGELQVSYDFTNNQLLFLKPGPQDTTTYCVIMGSDTVRKHLERPPIYLDGEEKLFVIIGTSIRYPAKARDNNVQGKVIIAFTIDPDGFMDNYRVKKSIGSGCDEEAMEAVKKINGNWLPGISNGKPVAVEYEMPLTFTLKRE